MLLSSDYVLAKNKDKTNTGVILCIVLASFIGIIGIVYGIYRLIRCRYAKDTDDITEQERFITVYGAV